MPQITILGIDPGVTSGYAQASYDSETRSVQIYPFQMVDEVDDLWRRLADVQPRYIVMEDFEYRNRARAGLVLKPVELIGVARLYSLVCKHQCALFLQKAMEGKGYYKDPNLKRYGLYKRGVPHGMDATRHLMHWLTFGAGHQLVQGREDFAMLVNEKPICG